MDEPNAYVTTAPDGTLVLVDPEAAAVMEVLATRACEMLLALNEDRVEHFLRRAVALRSEGRTDLCMVALDVDDALGGELAGLLMPGHDWQVYRDRGELPVARGLTTREGMADLLERVRPRTAEVLRGCPDDCLPIVTMAGGGILVTVRLLPTRGA